MKFQGAETRVKIPVWQGADTATILAKANYYLLACKKDPITPESYTNYRELCFVQKGTTLNSILELTCQKIKNQKLIG